MNSNKLILVTGASGYIASHVVQQLLDARYCVRGTARRGKFGVIRDFWEENKDFEATQIDDIATSDLTDALKDVFAILHIASPLPNKEDPARYLQSAVQGTQNIMHQAIAQGITKFVVTSSWAALVDPGPSDSYRGLTISEKHWGWTSREDLLHPGRDSVYVYSAAKILAEQAAWEFTKEHPEVDIATICPVYVYGPHILPLTTSSIAGVNCVYELIVGDPGRPIPFERVPFHVDVRDVARAHVRALELRPLPSGVDRQEKRFLVADPEMAMWDTVVKYLHETHPGLRDRLPSPEKRPKLPGPLSKNDVTRAKEVLGIAEYVDWRKTINDTIDGLLEAEKAGLITPADAANQ